MRNRTRLFALLLCMFLLCTLFSSCVYIATASGHRCEEAHCDICEHTALLTSLLRVTLTLTVLYSLFCNTLSGLARLYRASVGVSFAGTPVACKVRLNN